MTLFSLAEIKKRNEEKREDDALCSRFYPCSHDAEAYEDIDALIEEIQRLRAIRLPSGGDR